MAKTYKNGKTKTRRQRKNNKTNRRRYIRGGDDCDKLTGLAKEICEKRIARLKNTAKNADNLTDYAQNYSNNASKVKVNLGPNTWSNAASKMNPLSMTWPKR
jgi:hypothetical protein